MDLGHMTDQDLDDIEAQLDRVRAPPRCPRCGSYEWIYKGGKQVCAACGY